MIIRDVWWTPRVNMLFVRCDCGHQFVHPTNISTCTCARCRRSELWHAVKPALGIWKAPVMRLALEGARA